jgi:glutathione synthase/RimK-type ligase-like ATP-grasp enzyme
MRILLSDGTGLTSRQTATLLARAGHRVEALSPDPLCLCRFTRHVRQVHRVPAYGADPFGWLRAALAIAARQDIDVLFPTQEQVAVMSLAHDQLRTAGLLTAVPDFAALAQVQDKVTAFATLTRLGLPQPPATVIASAAQLAAVDGLPVFVKLPIGTASTGVCRVSSAAQLRELGARHESAGVFARGGVLAQQAVSGPLVMIQSVFARGQLIAFHACERTREGAGGGASHKRSIDLPHVREHISVLGSAIGWHGALSADVILSPDGPQFIDINPRLVEPVNASRSGVDLVGALLDVARHAPGETAGAGQVPDPVTGQRGVQTHQLLLAVLGAAQHGGRRRDVARQVWSAMRHRGDFRGSTEELTPLRGDPLTAVPVAIAALATTLRPASWQHYVSGSVDAYSLTPAAWAELTSQASATPDARPA